MKNILTFSIRTAPVDIYLYGDIDILEISRYSYSTCWYLSSGGSTTGGVSGVFVQHLLIFIKFTASTGGAGYNVFVQHLLIFINCLMFVGQLEKCIRTAPVDIYLNFVKFRNKKDTSIRTAPVDIYQADFLGYSRWFLVFVQHLLIFITIEYIEKMLADKYSYSTCWYLSCRYRFKCSRS